MNFLFQMNILMDKSIVTKMKNYNNIDITNIINYDFCIKNVKKKNN